jgi:dienelactone hydrolase
MRASRLLAVLLLFSPALAAQIPARDSRATYLPNTDTHFQPPVFTTLEAWEKRKIQLRKQILAASGLDPLPAKTPLNARIFGRVKTRDCYIEKVLIETMPGYFLGGNLYRPLDESGTHPAILNPHGHWTYGRLENQPLYSGPNLGANLARLGFVVFAWDMVGYNDTVQTPHSFGTPAEQLWGFGPFGLQAWNALRALDFVEALPGVDRARIGMTGASGGATQTFMLAAVDDRINFYAPVNMVSATMQGGDVCENAPGLRVGTNNVEIAAMMAPKPLLLVSATGDWTKNTPTEEYPALQRIYELYGKPGNIETVQLDAPHNYNKANREYVYRFFAKHILKLPNAASITERNADVLKLQDMLALYGQPLPAGAKTYDQLFAYWKQRTPSDPRSALSAALGVEWPDAVVQDATALSRPAAGDRVAYTFAEGKGRPALVVGGTKSNAPAGRPVMAIQVFGTRDQSGKHFLTFNRTDDQCRVQDILTALAWLSRKYPGQTI